MKTQKEKHQAFRVRNRQERSATASKARRDLPALRKSAGSLLDLYSKIFQSRRFTFKRSDNLVFMALCFVPRQAEYLKSVCLLTDAGEHNAAGLIARSMIEGLALLLLAVNDNTLPERWRAYAAVENLALLRKRELQGNKVTPDIRSAIELQVTLFGERFYKRKSRQKQSDGKPLPANPFHQNWYRGIHISDVFAKVRGDKLYEWIYWDTSRLAHWTVGGLTKDLRGDDESFEYTQESPAIAATALAAGFQSLHESLAFLDRYLDLGFQVAIEELQRQHVAIQNP